MVVKLANVINHKEPHHRGLRLTPACYWGCLFV
jgi:hypothetical protein